MHFLIQEMYLNKYAICCEVNITVVTVVWLAEKSKTFGLFPSVYLNMVVWQCGRERQPQQTLCDVCLRHKWVHLSSLHRRSIPLVWMGMCLCLCSFFQSACTPVSLLPGPCCVDIRVKPFEAGLIASCMTVWELSPPTLCYISHIVSNIQCVDIHLVTLLH